MLDYSNPALLFVRRIGQRLGILRPLQKLYRHIRRLPYERNFDVMMLEKIASGDTLWDIGANVGHFTTKFARIVGDTGRVHAFEPGQSAFAMLNQACAKFENVISHNIALSNICGILWFRDSGVEGDPTNGLVDHEIPGATKIEVFSGDELVGARDFPVPNAIKIDVEGFEFEIIEGMVNLILPNPALTRLFVEVHFLELNKRGMQDAPTIMVKTLERFGFSIKWSDPSHFLALRNAVRTG